jgi:glycosyltransferase involved in cell wall biosynthesis
MIWNFNKRIVFLCPSSIIPSGGVKQIYRNVKLLLDLGVDVILVLDNDGAYNKYWLINDYDITPYYSPSLFLTLYSNSLKKKVLFESVKIKVKSIIKSLLKHSRWIWQVRVDDIIVIPEIWNKDIRGVFLENDIIIFNQNCFYTVNNYANLDNLKGVLTVSKYAESFLKLIYQKDMVKRILLGIDTNVFSFEFSKKKIVCYMSRKRPDDIKQLLFLTNLCEDFNEWDFVNICNKSELEVARILKQSMIFLSTSDSEGFGLPPAEAMSCGCVVVGYDGGGGREFFVEGLNFKIQSGDILEYYNCLKEIVTDLNNDFHRFDIVRKSASDFIKSRYGLEAEKKSVQEAWVELLSNI